jgi:hypothetical protein
MGRVVELNSISETSSGDVRRWFSSPTTDLILWYEGERIRRFEFCYDKMRSEHVFVWTAEGSVRHLEVDDGEQSQGIGYKESPIYVPDGFIDVEQVQRELLELKDNLPKEVYSFVTEKVMEHTDRRDET